AVACVTLRPRGRHSNASAREAAVDDVAVPDRKQHRISRRQLIQRGVAVGASAWVAPSIIGSLASPAAATTVPTDCFSLFYPVNGSSGDGAASTDVSLVAGCCEPTGFGLHPNFQNVGAGCLPTVTGNCGGLSSTRTFTLPTDCNCVFVQGQELNGSSVCVAG